METGLHSINDEITFSFIQVLSSITPSVADHVQHQSCTSKIASATKQVFHASRLFMKRRQSEYLESRLSSRNLSAPLTLDWVYGANSFPLMEKIIFNIAIKGPWLGFHLRFVPIPVHSFVFNERKKSAREKSNQTSYANEWFTIVAVANSRMGERHSSWECEQNRSSCRFE